MRRLPSPFNATIAPVRPRATASDICGYCAQLHSASLIGSKIGGATQMTEFTSSRSGESVEMPAGESFQISLPENPTTGFQWNITATGKPVTIFVGDDFHPASGVGGQGTHYWRFRTAQAGEGEIRMVLQRSWKTPAETQKSFTLRVVVKP
jgi:inhibitor of cysteine peptidase